MTVYNVEGNSEILKKVKEGKLEKKCSNWRSTQENNIQER